jgi:hypothetical protein
MIMVLVTLAFIGAITYLWVTRGFMSALIHMVCVIAAGAIAFGVWEPLSLLLLNAAPNRGLASFLGGMAWALGLALPFAAALAILRVIADLLLPANAQCDSIVDGVGGGVCGFVSGVISAGIVITSIGFLRVDPQFWGYTSLAYTGGMARGSLERPETKFIPWADRLTASLYSHLSLTTLRTGRPMGIWHPEFDTFPASMRITYDGVSRNVMKPDDFSVISWYNVGDPQRPASLAPLLVDHWNDVPQRIMSFDGQPISSGYLTGLIVRFGAGARERGGYVAVGNGQVRLIVKRQGAEEAVPVHPIAVVTRTANPRVVEYARFRFDSDNMFISSVGAEATAVMAFEFPIPAGYRPIALYVKGVRYTLDGKNPSKNFPTVEARDRAVRDGEFDGMGGVGPILGPDGLPIQHHEPGYTTVASNPVTVSNGLQFVIQKGMERGLSVAQAARGWQIEQGQAKFSRSELQRNHGLEFRLQVNRFGVAEGTAMVQVDLSPGVRSSAFMRELDTADQNSPPQLVDSNDRPYPAVGFIFDDGTNYDVRYTRGQPIRNMLEVPRVSVNTPDRRIRLLFVVSQGVDVKEFRIGNTVLERYDPPLSTEFGQR